MHDIKENLKEKLRKEMARKMTSTDDMAMASYQYQVWMAATLLDWLDKNGYDVVQRGPLIKEVKL